MEIRTALASSRLCLYSFRATSRPVALQVRMVANPLATTMQKFVTCVGGPAGDGKLGSMAQISSMFQASRPSTSSPGPRPGSRSLDPILGQGQAGGSPKAAAGWGTASTSASFLPPAGHQKAPAVAAKAVARLPPPVFAPPSGVPPTGAAWDSPGRPGSTALDKSGSGGAGGMFQDLLAATRKSMAAGMGEWDLQSLDWGHPEFREHLLKVRNGRKRELDLWWERRWTHGYFDHLFES